MKILLTGGGTGGHFYPVIAIAEELNELAKEYRLLLPELFTCRQRTITKVSFLKITLHL